MKISIKRRNVLKGLVGLAATSGSSARAFTSPSYQTFDAHFHILEPGFPLIENQGYLPPFYQLKNYLKESRQWGARGGAIVSGSYQAYDQTYLLHALSRLDENWVGVTQLPFDVSDEEIARLAEARVRGVRFNLKRGETYDFDRIAALAHRVHSIGSMHSEFYADVATLASYVQVMGELPSISIDHLGLTKDGIPTLLKLVEGGAHVKASGFGRLDFDAVSVMKDISSIDETSLMFGSDVPSTRAKRPFQIQDVETIVGAFDKKMTKKVLEDNGRRFYRI